MELAHIWPAKFTGTGWFWLCLTTACTLNSFMMVPDRKQFRRIVIVGLTCIVWVQYVGDCLCGAGVPFFRYDVSRQGLLREHKRERAALEDLRARLIDPIAIPDEPLFIPDLSGGQISQVYPELAYPWGITPGLWSFSAVLLDGLPAESRIVEPDSTRISPAFYQLVEQDTFVRQLYSSPWQDSIPAADTPDSLSRPEDYIRRSD